MQLYSRIVYIFSGTPLPFAPTHMVNKLSLYTLESWLTIQYVSGSRFIKEISPKYYIGMLVDFVIYYILFLILCSKTCIYIFRDKIIENKQAIFVESFYFIEMLKDYVFVPWYYKYE